MAVPTNLATIDRETGEGINERLAWLDQKIAAIKDRASKEAEAYRAERRACLRRIRQQTPRK